MKFWHLTAFSLILFTTSTAVGNQLSCERLLRGQYFCVAPEVDPATQQYRDCKENGKAPGVCSLAPGVDCAEADANRTFVKNDLFPCGFGNQKSHRTALLLSIFLGWLGVDRFYLGYPALGLFKLCTVGFMFIFHLLDVVLIALQVVTPANGLGYQIDFYGPRADHLVFNNQTVLLQPHY